MSESRRDRLRRAFWARHANPWSGWSRALTLPLLVHAIFAGRWRLLGAAVLFTLVNPVLFPPPDDADAWMTKVVLAERHWRETGDDLGALGLLNLANVPVTLYALYAAYRRRPGGATVATALSMTLKFAFVAALVRRYGDELDELPSGRFGDDPSQVP